MDPTILAAGAGIVGGVIGAIIGGVFALKATKRQVEVMLLQSRDIDLGTVATDVPRPATAQKLRLG